MTNREKFLYIIILLFISLQLKPFFLNVKNNVSKSDTITITKYLPSKTNIFVKDSLIPVYITKYRDTSKHYAKLLKELEEKYKKKADSVIILRELLHSKRKRVYKETFKDSILQANVTAHTTGVLDSLQFNYKTSPLKVEYKEVNNYITPKYRVLGGIGLDGYSINANLGFQTEKGHIYYLGVNSKSNINLGVKFNLLTKY